MQCTGVVVLILLFNPKCGKLFTTQEFLREHTAKKHNTAVSGQQVRENSPNSIKIKTPPLLPHMKLEQSAAPKQQLRLHVLTPTGNCVQVGDKVSYHNL